MTRKNYILLALLSFAFLLSMWPEFYSYYDLNDASLPQVQAELVADRILAFENPLDFFIEEWACGFPLFGHYQMLPPLTLGLLYLLFFKLFSTIWIYHVLCVLLLAAYPWSFYFAIKRFGLSEKQSIAAALFCLIAHSSIGFGHEFASYVAYGSGLYTQLFAMILFPWALVLGFETISGKTKRLFPAVLFFSLLALSHVFLLYFVFLILGIWWLLGICGKRLASLKGLIIAGGATFLTVSFFLVPMVLNSKFHAFSRYEPLGKTNSYGLSWVVSEFLKGGLLDQGRLPILTLLVLVGLFVAFRKALPPVAMAVGFLMSMVLFFGRTTWGAMANLLPMASDIHFERFIIGIHFFGAALAGIGAAWLIDRISAIEKPGLRMAVFALCIPVAALLLAEPHRYLKQNRAFVKGMHVAKKQDDEKIRHAFDWIKSDSPGRLYAGMRARWGNNFRLAGVPVFFHAVYQHLPVVGHLAFGWALPGDFSVQMNEKRSDHLNLFNITHIPSWQDDNYWQKKPAYLDDNIVVYRNHSTGWIELVETPVSLVADKYSFWNVTTRWLKSPLPAVKQHLRLCFDDCDAEGYSRRVKMTDPLHYHLKMWQSNTWVESDHAVFESVSPLGKDYAANPIGSIQNQNKKGTRWFATVQAGRPAVAMLKATYHPFWRATVNGKSVKPFMVSPGYVAVDVPQGQSKIEFYYRPALYKWLLLLLFPGVLISTYLLDRKRTDDQAESFSPAINGKKTAAYFCIAVFALLGIANAHRPDPIPLENMPVVGINQFEVAYEKPRRLSIDGIVFDTGIRAYLGKKETWSRSYRLDGKYKQFESWVGISDDSWSCNKDPKAAFEVWVDGKQVYKSSTLAPGRRPRYVKADLTDKNLLMIKTIAIGDSDCTQGAWAKTSLKK